MLVLTGTMTAAKESKTRGTIAKLDAAMLDIFESYQERFENILSMSSDYSTYIAIAGNFLTSTELAKLKLHLMYDLMRMEMPSYWNEISNDLPANNGDPYPTLIPPIYITSGNLKNDTTSFQFRLDAQPPVYEYYLNEAKRIRDENCDYDNGPAEMLFLIIANLNPEALENFHGSEIGDTNNNGAREFLDAWGRPIYFLRFAPGFTDSDLQPDVVKMANLSLTTGAFDNATLWDNPLPTDLWDTTTDLGAAYAQAIAQASDPFDPDEEARQSWFLYPLIISAGADGLFDIAYGRRNAGGNMDPPTTSSHINPFNFPTGIPQDYENSGKFHHYDNIHNHRSSNSF
jgi:hypothetical protein